MEKFEKFVVVDLGQLTKTKFGNSISQASITPSHDGPILGIDTGVIKREMKLQQSPVAGSYILYDEDGSLIGSAETEFTLKPDRE